LHLIQSQHIESTRYEFLDLPEITEHCTSWPPATEFSSIIQHQNFDINYQLPLDGL
jgi:hypothetical protein